MGPAEPSLVSFFHNHLINHRPLTSDLSLKSDPFLPCDIEKSNDQTWYDVALRDKPICFICQETLTINDKCIATSCNCKRPLHAKCMLNQSIHGEREKRSSTYVSLSDFVVKCACQTPFLGAKQQQYLEEASHLWVLYLKKRRSQKALHYKTLLPRIIVLAENIIKHIYKHWKSVSPYNPFLASALGTLAGCYLEWSNYTKPNSEYLQLGMYCYLIQMHVSGPTAYFLLCGSQQLISYISIILSKAPNHPELKRIVPIVVKYLCKALIHVDDAWQPKLRRQIQCEYGKLLCLLAKYKQEQFLCMASLSAESLWTIKQDVTIDVLFTTTLFRRTLYRLGKKLVSDRFIETLRLSLPENRKRCSKEEIGGPKKKKSF